MTHPRSHSKSGPQSPPFPPLHWPTGSSLLGYFPHIESGCSLPSLGCEPPPDCGSLSARRKKGQQGQGQEPGQLGLKPHPVLLTPERFLGFPFIIQEVLPQ